MPPKSKSLFLKDNKRQASLLENAALGWQDKMIRSKLAKQSANQKRALSRVAKNEHLLRLQKQDSINNAAKELSIVEVPTAFLHDEVTKLVASELNTPSPIQSKASTISLINAKAIEPFSISVEKSNYVVRENASSSLTQQETEAVGCSIAGFEDEPAIKRKKLEIVSNDREERDTNLGLRLQIPLYEGSAMDEEEEDAAKIQLPSINGRPVDPNISIFASPAMKVPSQDTTLTKTTPSTSGVSNALARGYIPMQEPSTFASIQTNIEQPSEYSLKGNTAQKPLTTAEDEGSEKGDSSSKISPKKRKASKKRKQEKDDKAQVSLRTLDDDVDDETDIIGEDTSNYDPQTVHGPWVDIHAKVKLFVCMAPRNLSNSDVMIRHANEDFFVNFGFEKDSTLPMPLKSLFGHGTNRLVLHKLHMALLTGKQVYEFINLYRADNRPLACHVVLVSITGNRNKVSSISSSSSSSSSAPDLVSQSQEKYGILTIRSASVIGNAKSYGIGFFGPGRIISVQQQQQRIDRQAERQSAGIEYPIPHYEVPVFDSSYRRNPAVAASSSRAAINTMVTTTNAVQTTSSGTAHAASSKKSATRQGQQQHQQQHMAVDNDISPSHDGQQISWPSYSKKHQQKGWGISQAHVQRKDHIATANSSFSVVGDYNSTDGTSGSGILSTHKDSFLHHYYDDYRGGNNNYLDSDSEAEV